MSRDKVWYLFARKLAKEASKEEINELDVLLKDDVSLYNEISTLNDFWKNNPEPDHDFLEPTYILHYEKMKKLGVEPDSGELNENFSENGNQLKISAFRRRKVLFTAAILLFLDILPLAFFL